jgi:translation initiation factor 1 (eIF-1/SUI1)
MDLTFSNNDPFNQLEDELSTSLNSQLVIQTESRGRKTNTFLAGWEISREQLKEHLKNLKRSHGCNGSIKNTTISGVECENVLHLQGDQVDNLLTYLDKIGINTKEIEIKSI